MFEEFYNFYALLFCAFFIVIGILDFSWIGFGVALYGLFISLIIFREYDVDFLMKEILYVDNS